MYFTSFTFTPKTGMEITETGVLTNVYLYQIQANNNQPIIKRAYPTDRLDGSVRERCFQKVFSFDYFVLFKCFFGVPEIKLDRHYIKVGSVCKVSAGGLVRTQACRGASWKATN